MANWLHRLLNPHCEHCQHEREDARHCNSCEVLRMENERLRQENSKLLDKILAPPPVPEQPKFSEEKIPIPRALPWPARRQLLEQEDREKAKLMRQAPQPDTIEDLEKQLDIAQAEREKQ